MRLLFAATVVAGLSAPMLGASAATNTRGVDVHDPDKGGFVVPNHDPPNSIEISPGDAVKWTIWEGKHNITPKDAKWGGDGSGELNPESDPYFKTFKTAGDYFYFCSIHSSADDVGKPNVGMWGVVHVIDTTTTTAAPPPPPPPVTQPPATTTTRPSTPPATTATAPTTAARPAPAAPAPTTTTAAKDKKQKDPKEETTTTSSTLPPPVDLPDSANIPALPSASTPGADPGAGAEAPVNAPEGEAVALLKGKKDKGGGAVKLLIVSGIGLGALGIGSGAYKYANRSSKYFPA
jgi:plastocyanin